MKVIFKDWISLKYSKKLLACNFQAKIMNPGEIFSLIQIYKVNYKLKFHPKHMKTSLEK